MCCTTIHSDLPSTKRRLNIHFSAEGKGYLPFTYSVYHLIDAFSASERDRSIGTFDPGGAEVWILVGEKKDCLLDILELIAFFRVK